MKTKFGVSLFRKTALFWALCLIVTIVFASWQCTVINANYKTSEVLMISGSLRESNTILSVCGATKTIYPYNLMNKYAPAICKSDGPLDVRAVNDKDKSCGSNSLCSNFKMSTTSSETVGACGALSCSEGAITGGPEGFDAIGVTVYHTNPFRSIDKVSLESKLKHSGCEAGDSKVSGAGKSPHYRENYCTTNSQGYSAIFGNTIACTGATAACYNEQITGADSDHLSGDYGVCTRACESDGDCLDEPYTSCNNKVCSRPNTEMNK